MHMNSRSPRLYSIGDSRGRKWAFPRESLTQGLAVYQPSGIRGHVLRMGLAASPRFILPMILDECTLDDLIGSEVATYLRWRFGEPKCFFSVFMGTPSPHQKATVQVYTHDRIVAYCKVAASPAIGGLFKEESDLLDYMHECGLACIPRSLGVEQVADSYVFVQDTLKKFGARVPHRLGKAHFEFADLLAIRTEVAMSYEETDFFRILTRGEAESSALPAELREVYECALRSTAEGFSGRASFCVAHRDFAPWNTCLGPEGLFVFDFEYAARSYPARIDLHNFVISVGMHKYQWEGPRLYHEHRRVFGDRHRDLLIACLVDNIAQYLLRGGDDDLAIAIRYGRILEHAWGSE